MWILTLQARYHRFTITSMRRVLQSRVQSLHRFQSMIVSFTVTASADTTNPTATPPLLYRLSVAPLQSRLRQGGGSVSSGFSAAS
jgi:hypothetical protein